MDDQCLLKDGFYLVELVDINLLLFAPIRTSGTFKPMQTRSFCGLPRHAGHGALRDLLDLKETDRFFFRPKHFGLDS